MPFFRLPCFGAARLLVAAAVLAGGCLALGACIIGPKHDEPAASPKDSRTPPLPADVGPGFDEAGDTRGDTGSGATDTPSEVTVPPCGDGGDSGDAPADGDTPCGDDVVTGGG